MNYLQTGTLRIFLFYWYNTALLPIILLIHVLSFAQNPLNMEKRIRWLTEIIVI